MEQQNNMNKILKTILISSVAIFGVCLIFSEPVQAQLPVDVEFENEPLFDKANFLPGDDVSRFVKVTNNTDVSQKVGTRVSDFDDDYNLGDVLNLQIKEGGIILSSSTLSDFFNAGVIYLSEVPAYSSTQYDFIITFISESGNNYQGKTLTFDFIVGIDISETTTTTTVPPLGPTGSYVPGQYVPPSGVVAGATTGQTTTTTIPPTTTTTIPGIPGEVAGEATQREFFEDGVEEGFSGITTTTTTTTLPGLVLGKSIIRIPSCPVNLIMSGINPLLSYLLCLGQNACKACISPWLVLLLGLITTFGGAILAKKHHE